MANLSQADLRKTDIRHANLQWALLTGSNLHEAILTSANLAGADLFRANLQGAVLLRTNLQCANLSYANLCGADLTDADLSGATLRGVVYDECTRWPENVIPIDLLKDSTTRARTSVHGVAGVGNLRLWTTQSLLTWTRLLEHGILRVEDS